MRLSFAHRPAWFGFRVDLDVGATANSFMREDPEASTHPGLARWLSYVEQAFGTLSIPVGRGIDIDVGKFGTPVGFEDNESIGNWNYSRGLLYSWAEPSLHTGVRLTINPSSTVAMTTFLVNGWNANLIDGNGMRTFATAATFKPRSDLALTLVYMGGPERAPTRLSDPTLNFRTIVNAYVSYSPVHTVSVAMAADVGTDQSANGIYWYGASGYVRFAPRSWIATAFRTEALADPQGFMTGTPQTVADFTTTLEFQRRIGPARFVTRLEYRHDQSTSLVFQHTALRYRPTQDTLTLALLSAF